MPFHRVVVGNRLLAAVVHGVHGAAGQDGVAANLAHLFQHDDGGAVLVGLHGSSQTSAARADDHHVSLQHHIGALFHNSFLLLAPGSRVQAGLGHSVQGGSHDGFTGEGRGGNSIHIGTLHLHNAGGDLLHRRIADTGGIAVLGDFHIGHHTVFIHGYSNLNGAGAADLAVTHTGEHTGFGNGKAAHGQQHGHGQHQGKNLLHTHYLLCTFGLTRTRQSDGIIQPKAAMDARGF